MLAYASANRRADFLCQIIDELEDDWIDGDVRAAGLSAVRSMQGMFSPSAFMEGWEQALNKYLRKEHLLALVFLSPIISKHHPLPVIRLPQLNSMIEALNEALDEIERENTLPDWAKSALEEGILELRFRLRHFVLFGHDETTSRLYALLSKASAIAQDIEKARGQGISLPKLLLFFVLATDVFAAPHNISQAYVTYSGWATGLLENAKPLLSPPLRQIEGPKSAADV